MHSPTLDVVCECSIMLSRADCSMRSQLPVHGMVRRLQVLPNHVNPSRLRSFPRFLTPAAPGCEFGGFLCLIPGCCQVSCCSHRRAPILTNLTAAPPQLHTQSPKFQHRARPALYIWGIRRLSAGCVGCFVWSPLPRRHETDFHGAPKLDHCSRCRPFRLHDPVSHLIPVRRLPTRRTGLRLPY